MPLDAATASAKRGVRFHQGAVLLSGCCCREIHFLLDVIRHCEQQAYDDLGQLGLVLESLMLDSMTA